MSPETADPKAPTVLADEARPAVPASRAGTRFGKFLLLELVGTGGFGTVYKAVQTDLGRTVALKLLHSQQPGDLQRFEREAQTAAQLVHRNIVPLYEVGDCEGQPYIAMEFVDGASLHALGLPPRRAVEVARDAALAVHFAHEKGIIHRDLKPSNLMMGGDGHVWVMDFGLARPVSGGSALTLSGTTVGTPAYMSPEQAEGRRCDARSDVYSLGATLYELLAGRPPFDGATPLDILRRVTESDAISIRRLNPKVPSEIETILQKAMEKDPDRRYATAADFAEDLRRHLAGEAILARPAGPLTRSLKWVRRHPAFSAVGVVIVLASLAIAGLSLFHAGRAEALRSAAEADADRARKAESRANDALSAAQLRRAEGLVAQGDALGLAGRWKDAKECYEDARAAFAEAKASPLAADLGMLEAWRHAPPALLHLTGSAPAIHGLALLPDGRRALSTGKKSISLWDLETGREVRRHAGHAETVQGVAVSPDGRSALSCGSDRKILHWDLETGQVLRTLAGHTDRVMHAAFLPDGRRALSSSWDRTLRLWDLETGASIRCFTGHEAMVIGIALSPDGRRVLSASWDRSARLWDVESGREILSLPGQTGHVSAAAWSPDGRLLLTGARDATLRLWNAADGTPAGSLEGHRAWINCAAFSPDGRRILSGGHDRTVRLWDTGTRREIRVFTGHPGLVSDVTFLPSGRQALSSDESGHAFLWDLDPPDQIRLLEEEPGPLLGVAPPAARLSKMSDLDEKAARVGAAFTPDSRLLVTGSWDGLVRVWDVETGRELRRLAGHKGAVEAVAVSPDGRTALSGGSNGELRLWELASGRVGRTWVVPGKRLRSAVFAPDGGLVLTCGGDGRVRLWETETGREVREFGAPGFDPGSAILSPAGGLVFAATAAPDGTIKSWKADTGDEFIDLKHPDGVAALAASPDGRTLLSAGVDQALRRWDLATGREERALEGHTNRLRAAAWSPDGSLILSTGEDRGVKLWDAASGRELRSLGEHSRMGVAAMFSPDGRFAFSAGKDKEIRLVDLRRVELGRALEPRARGAVRALQADPKDAGALAVLGRWHAFRRSWGRAATLLESARDAGAKVASLELARVLQAAGDRDGARREFQRALEAREAPEGYLRLCLTDPSPSPTR